jgi:hypothetical protein
LYTFFLNTDDTDRRDNHGFLILVEMYLLYQYPCKSIKFPALGGAGCVMRVLLIATCRGCHCRISLLPSTYHVRVFFGCCSVTTEAGTKQTGSRTEEQPKKPKENT